MTVHMFRVFIGPGKMSISDLETRINDWVASNPEWTADTVEHTLTERNTATDGTGATYYGVDVRFEQSDTKANLLQKATDKVKDKVDWYRVGYHACEHDIETIIDTVTGEEWVANHDTAVELSNDDLVATSETVYDNGEEVFPSSSNYEMDYENGTITAKSGGTIRDGVGHTINYDYYVQRTSPCSWDDAVEWTAKDVTIPSGVPTFEVPA